MNGRELLTKGLRYLSRAGVDSPGLESEVFLSHTLNCSRVGLYLDNPEVEEKQQQYFWQLLKRRVSGVPLQYILGTTEFMGLRFKVRPQVFIPRPETEILVEAALKLSMLSPKLSVKVLDLGTGCGNIAISCAKYLTGRHIFTCDISDSALQLSAENARMNKTAINLVGSDLFCGFKKAEFFSLIISNPPYISTPDSVKLPRELNYEPRLALDGGQDGLSYYYMIINQSPDYLQNNGWLVLEIGDQQAASVRAIFAQTRRFSQVKIIKDYRRLDRVAAAQKIK